MSGPPFGRATKTEGRREGTTMSESSSILAYALEHQYPYPIAMPYRCAQTARSGSERVAYILATVDGLLRYAGCISLADFFSKGPSEEKVAQVERLLAQPTPDKWAQFLLASGAELAERSPFMPELGAALCYKKGKPTQTGTALLKLARTCSELLGEKDTLVDEAKASAMADELMKELETVAGKLDCLEKYPLVLFRQQTGQGEGPSAGFRGFMLRWMGHRTPPLPIGVEFDGTVPQGVVIAASPDYSRGLVLAPFASVLTVASKQAEALFLATSIRDDGTLKLENTHVGKFAVFPLRSSDDRPASLGGYMESWAASGGVTALTPSAAAGNRLRFKSKLLPSEKVLEGRYKPLGFMGRGGIGAVYRVQDMEEMSDKAVKILYPDLSRNEFFTRYFLDTGSALSQLKHPNVVPVFEAGYSSTLQENHILMAYMHGGSLAELLDRRDTLPPQEALKVAIAVLEALHFLHGKGLIHGGIHPGNILFDKDGNPCLGDFGILKLPSSRVTTFRPLERLHSLRYASPELLLGQQASGASDLYSVALVLYEMLTGQVPSKTEYVPPSELIFPIPELLDKVLGKALSMTPEERYPTALQLAKALLEVQSGMGAEYEVSPTALAQQLAGHLCDVHSGHTEALDLEREEKLAKGDYEGASRIIHMKIDQIWDTNEKVFWMKRLADLYFDKLDMPGKAVSILRDGLDLAPDNPAAVAAIVSHFQKTGQWVELRSLLEEMVEQTDSADYRSKYLEKLVEVCHVRLEDVAAASTWLEKLVEITGAQERWIELLVQLKEEAKDYAGAARAVEKWLRETPDEQQKAGLYRRLAILRQTKLEQPEEAVSAFEKLLQLLPEDRGGMDGLRTLYRQSFAYSSLASLLRRMLESKEYSATEKIELYQELGEILSSYLYDTKEAQAVWNELLRIDPKNHTALSYLERLYLREGQNDRYLEVLTKKAESCAEPQEKASVLLTAALARVEFLADVAGARALLEEGLALAPGHAGIEAALERLYREHGDVDAESRLLLSRLEKEEQSAIRLEILWKLAGLFDGTGNAAAALEVMKQAFREDRTSPKAQQELDRLLGILADWEGAVTFYMGELAAAAGPAREHVAARVAAICTEHLKDREKALYAVEQANKLFPGFEPIQKALLALLRETGQWDELGALTLRLLKAGGAGENPELFASAARIVDEQLAGSQAGLELLLELTVMAKAYAGLPAMDVLKSACRRCEQWVLLAELAEMELGREKDPARAQSLRYEAGRSYLKLKDYAKARKWLEEALEGNPQDTGTQKALEETLSAQGDSEGLLKLYRRLIPLADMLDEKEAYLESAAKMEADVFGRLNAAIELYRQLLTLAPEKVRYAKGFAAVLKKAEKFSEMAWLLEQLAKRLEGEEKKSLLLELAELHYGTLKNTDSAIQVLRQVVRMAPEDREAFDRLRKVCQQENRYDTLLKLLGERAKTSADEERWTLKVEMARVSAFEMGLAPPAKTYLDEVLAQRPEHDEAFALYRTILERQEDVKGLSTLMARQFAALTDETRRAKVGLELAELYAGPLDLKVKAVEILERIWDTDPNNRPAALLLAQVYSQLVRWDKTASILSVLQGQTTLMEPDQTARYAFLSGKTYEALLQRPKAIEAFRQAVSLGYKVEESRQSLATLLYLEEQFAEARTLIGELVAAGTMSMQSTREFQNLLSDIERRMGRLDKSREHLEAVLRESPGDKDVIRKLIELSRERSDSVGEIEFTKRLLEVETDPEKRFPLLVALGDAASQVSGREEEGIAAYGKAFELRPSSKGVAVSLGQLQMKAGQWGPAASSFFEAEKLETDLARKAALALSQALLFTEKAGTPDQAVPHLQRCLEHDPAKLEAFSMLEKMAVEKMDWEQQRRLYESTLDRLGERADKELLFKLNINLGNILLEKFGETAAALSRLETATRLKPDDPAIVELTAGIYLESDDQLDRAVEAFRKLLATRPRDAKTLGMLRKAFAKMKRYDEAWFAAGALEYLGAASPKEKEFYQKLSSSALKIKPKVIDVERLRNDLLAPEEDWELTEVLRILYERMLPHLALQSPKTLGHGKKTAFGPEQSKVFAGMLEIVSKVLGIQVPGAYIRETSGWLLKEACYPPALVMGADVAGTLKGKELRFELARNLALFLPQHIGVGVADLETTRALLGNVLKLSLPGFPEPPGDPKTHAGIRKEMERRIPAAELGKIRELVGKLRAKGGELSVKKWLVGVEKTAARFGLLFANDLIVAARQISACPNNLSVAARDEIVDDLVLYAVSESFSRLRGHLSIATA
jgi:serine/threonine-protein kinase